MDRNVFFIRFDHHLSISEAVRGLKVKHLHVHNPLMCHVLNLQVNCKICVRSAGLHEFFSWFCVGV